MAAQRAYPDRRRPFWDYAILGDDVVIGDCKVASESQTLLQQMGVSISMKKSTISSILDLTERAAACWFIHHPIHNQSNETWFKRSELCRVHKQECIHFLNLKESGTSYEKERAERA
jgi:hypothetical protein